MRWQKKLHLPKNQKTNYDSDELQTGVKGLVPIVEISEVVRPRLSVSIDLPKGMNVLTSVCYHTEKRAYQVRMRIRDSKGGKMVLKPSNWLQLDRATAEYRK